MNNKIEKSTSAFGMLLRSWEPGLRRVIHQGRDRTAGRDRSRKKTMNIDPVVHGALDFAELERLGIHPDDILDFSVNSNPFGPSPLIWDAIRSTPLERYPDRESIALRRALSKKLDVLPEQIVIGNGTAELIQMMGLALLQKGDHALILEPTFGEYERCLRLAGTNIHRWHANPENGFILQPVAIEKKLDEQEMRVVFVCNPNNPTGQVLPLDILDKWARSHPDTLFVVDEAYLAFAAETPSAVSLHRKNILIMCSMTKDYAIAGLRLGYAVGDAAMIKKITNLCPAWNVNALAQAAGLVVLQDETHLTETLAKLYKEKNALVSELEKSGYDPVPSQTQYFLLPVEDGAQFRRKLLEHRILVRDCSSFGLPSYVRIATRKPEENARLLDAIRKI